LSSESREDIFITFSIAEKGGLSSDERATRRISLIFGTGAAETRCVWEITGARLGNQDSVKQLGKGSGS
jgi:hypothetical protein